jgi:hypothetical protein
MSFERQARMFSAAKLDGHTGNPQSGRVGMISSSVTGVGEQTLPSGREATGQRGARPGRKGILPRRTGPPALLPPGAERVARRRQLLDQVAAVLLICRRMFAATGRPAVGRAAKQVTVARWATS